MGEERHIRLMIVDDDEDDIYLIKDAIDEIHGTRYKVTAVSSALSAMAELSKGQFDVILSDYRLGVTTGIDFIRSVRAAGIDTPIILLTGLADSVIDRAAQEAGASDFLPKSGIGPDVLDRTIRYALAHDQRQRLLHAVLKSTNTGVALVGPEGDVTLWNPRFVEFARSAFGEDAARFGKLVDLVKSATGKDIVAGDRILEAHMNSVADSGYVLALQDVTERVNDLKEREAAELRVRRIAMEDGLTGLPNRMAFNEFLDKSICDADLAGNTLTVLSFDFNRFKEVNDLFGHAAGDCLLKTTAERLRAELSETEFAARLGGDEFVLVHLGTGVDETKALGQRISRALQQPLHWEGKQIEPGVSIGIAIYPEHGRTREELLANADLAMYRAKMETGTDICIFDISMDHFIRERRKIALDLRKAIGDEELSLHFQPQFRADDGSLVGFEALLRWKNHLRGYVSPAEFIPIAEENGLINDIDSWVLRRACEEAMQWKFPARVAINVSARAICQPGIAASVREILTVTGLPPRRLELEVTETALIQDLNRALHSLRQIKAMGISIAMDDFGTGYSSLSLLNSFPFDRIKIDKSFIQNASTNERAEAIFKAVTGLGAALSVPVLVEGIEDIDQHAFAREAGCEEVQGFLYGRPVPGSALAGLFESGDGSCGAKEFQAWQAELEASQPRRLSA